MFKCLRKGFPGIYLRNLPSWISTYDKQFENLVKPFNFADSTSTDDQFIKLL